MNTTLRLIAALTLSAAAAAPVLAQEATPDTWLQQAQSTKTRAQVQAELAAARADGSINAWAPGYMERVASTQSREAVRAVTRAAIANGEVAAINSETHDLDRALVRRATGTMAAAR